MFFNSKHTQGIPKLCLFGVQISGLWQ